MGEKTLTHMPLKMLPAPIARLMPILLEYVRLTAERGVDVGPEVKRQYVAHVRVLKAFLTALGKIAGSTHHSLEPLIKRCGLLGGLFGSDAAQALSELVEGVHAVYDSHRKLVRAAIADHPDLFHDLYRDGLSPKRILTVLTEETWGELEMLGEKLIERCWYGHRHHHERDGLAPLPGIDVVLFAPGQRPIQTNIEEAIVARKAPIIVLAGLNTTDDPPSMASLRTDHRYRQAGYRVLRRPFSPVRLYQVIDGIYLRHMARIHPAPSLALMATN